MVERICKKCNKEKRHHAKGLCKSCYNLKYKKNQKERTRRWLEKNPDYFKNYYQKKKDENKK